MRGEPSVVAIVAMFNEADIIVPCIEALNAQGVQAYVLDDGSTDASVSLVEPLIGRGVVGLERLESDGSFNLTRILKRKEALASELDADWFINHDADEFRESPWLGVSLADALRRVDAAGFNAVDFALFDFWQAAVGREGGGQGEGHYSPGATYNSIQVRCWKRCPTPVDLVTSAGHDVQFPGRKTFPLRFVLKHYPIRSAEHAARKIWHERIPRFDRSERAKGWHVQYDALTASGSPVPGADDTLVPYEPARVRMDTAIADLRTAETSTDALVGMLLDRVRELQGALSSTQRDIEHLRQVNEAQVHALSALQAERTVLLEQQQRLEGQLTSALAELERSQG